ncbi:MAG: hypothetical protein AAFN16_21515 [Pseudomonadota bacterium]
MKIDKFRFWIGSEKERISSVWYIWDRNGQVYMTSKAFGGNIKLSVHAKRAGQPNSDHSCQFGFTSEYRENGDMAVLQGSGPSFLRWKRKPATPEKAHVLAKLLFPTDFLRKAQPAPKRRKNKHQFFAHPAPSGKCVQLDLVACARPETEGDFWYTDRPASTLIHMPLGESEQCIVVGRQADFDASFLPLGKTLHIPSERDPKLKSMKPGETSDDYSLSFWSQPEDFGVIQIVECSGLTLTKNSHEQLNSS